MLVAVSDGNPGTRPGDVRGGAVASGGARSLRAVGSKPQTPSPAMVVACVALFLALGGSGYAASRIVSPTPRHQRSGHKPSQKALIKAAVAKYFARHRGQFVGPQGLEGKAGGAGPRGEIGPAGLASVSARLAGPVSTGSASPVDLGGPSVTVNVGPSGLVAYWATATLTSVGGGTAQVSLYEPSGNAPQIEGSLSSPVKLYTKPGSDTGTTVFNGGLSTLDVGSGSKTLSLRFADTAGTGIFENVELVVIPL